LTIGQGTVTIGVFSAINWGQHAKSLQVEMDPGGGTSYVDLGTQQMMSVPYALCAEKLRGIALPNIVTYSVIEIQSTNAKVSFNLVNNGGTEFTIKGLCWSVDPIPTINDQSIMIGVGQGTSIGHITGLTPNTHYFIRTFATNQSGTVYGNIVNATTKLKIGDDYKGGKVAYILKSNDVGYIAGEVHGIIAAPTDQSSGIGWGCYPTFLNITSTSIGSGSVNTSAIVTNCSNLNIAARICQDLELNGYIDWYLPSFDELKQLYYNRFSIGSFENVAYWSSTEFNQNDAWKVVFSNGVDAPDDKFYTHSVRAIRSF
jgi:hypothetical protein